MITVLYDEYAGEEIVSEIAGADLVLVVLNFAAFYPDCINNIYSGRVTSDEIRTDATQKSKELFMFLKERTLSPVIWFGFEDYGYQYEALIGTVDIGRGLIDGINMELHKLITESDIFVDLKRLIAGIGIRNAYSSKGKYRWNAPYSKALIIALCEEVLKQYLIYTGVTKKCLVLDCDNVLWGGILSEDGIEKIQLGEGLGRPYQDFQRFLLTLYYHGVILTVCSKNDETDVLNVFREHSGMILKEEHIACFKVNWNNKPDNIRKVSEELNIGLDSIVFVDDSEFEVQSVRAMLPEVTSILFNRDTICAQLSCFNLESNIDIGKVKQRTETYRTNTQRRTLQAQSASHEEYLRALETKVDIHIALPSELARIAELTQRTNKCTNGIRYTVDQLKQKLQDGDYSLYSVTVSDKFSNLGLVGAIGIDRYSLDLFSLSCRSLGRGVEEQMLKVSKENKVTSYRFVPTQKNGDWYMRFKDIGCEEIICSK